MRNVPRSTLARKEVESPFEGFDEEENASAVSEAEVITYRPAPSKPVIISVPVVVKRPPVGCMPPPPPVLNRKTGQGNLTAVGLKPINVSSAESSKIPSESFPATLVSPKNRLHRVYSISRAERDPEIKKPLIYCEECAKKYHYMHTLTESCFVAAAPLNLKGRE